MIPRPSIMALFSLTLACIAWPSYGDGCFVWRNRDVDILQPEQKAVIEWNGRTEKLTIETKFKGPADEMVWIVPAPVKPDVQKADLEVLEEMSRRTQTPYVLHAQIGLRLSSVASPLVTRECATTTERRHSPFAGAQTGSTCEKT